MHELAQHLLAVYSPRGLSVLWVHRDAGKGAGEWPARLREAEAGSLGRAQKVSVSLPEGLTEVVRHRVGKGEFSRYVADAVARQLEMDLLAELAAQLDAEHGPIPEESIAEARAAWPDGE